MRCVVSLVNSRFMISCPNGGENGLFEVPECCAGKSKAAWAHANEEKVPANSQKAPASQVLGFRV